MFIAVSKCDWKCCVEAGKPPSMCQNSPIAKQPDIEVSADEIFRRYIQNPITKAVVIGGLEPFQQTYDIFELASCFRGNGCTDDIVIYTGYEKKEILENVQRLSLEKNIVIKFGRFKPDEEKRYDNVLGIWLSSGNQYAERIS